MGPTVAATPQLPRTRRLYGAAALALSAVFTGAFALWNPPLRDLAAHTFRADYFPHYGLALWNGSWYGGEYMLTYSHPVPAAGRAAHADRRGRCLGDRLRVPVRRLVRARLGRKRPHREPLVRGARIAGAARQRLACVRARRGVRARRHSARCSCGRPVIARLCRAGDARSRARSRPCFLALVLVAGGLARGTQPGQRPASWSRAARWCRSRCSRLRSPSRGRFPFWFSAYWPLALTCMRRRCSRSAI